MKNNKRILFIIHLVVLVIFFVISLFFAPFAAFLYDDPRAGGFLLYLFSGIWFGMPVFVGASLLIAVLLAILKHKKLAKKITFVPYVVILVEIIIGVIFFNVK